MSLKYAITGVNRSPERIFVMGRQFPVGSGKEGEGSRRERTCGREWEIGCCGRSGLVGEGKNRVRGMTHSFGHCERKR